MIVDSIYVYPVKSMRGIKLEKALVEEEGLKYDRRWMLIDENGKFISQRDYPILSQFVTKLSNSHLNIGYKDSNIEIPLESVGSEKINVSVWNSKFKSNTIHVEYNQWLSEQLGAKVRIVKMEKPGIRHKRLFKDPWKTIVSYADGYPYLILGTASLELLNDKLESPLGMERFRPNIVVKTDIPHIEDEWNNIKMGNSVLLNIKPCARCIMTTINQETSELAAEPLKTLNGYRKRKNKILFGSNAIYISGDEIRVGDNVNVE